MICTCGNPCKVIDSRKIWAGEEDKLVRRRYECKDYRKRFSTVEVDEHTFDTYKKRAIEAETKLYAIRKELKKVIGAD